MAFLPGYEAVPIVRAEQRPRGDRLDLRAAMQRPQRAMPDISEPADLIVDVGPVVDFRDGDGNSIAAPGFSDNLLRAGDALQASSDGFNVGVNLSAVSPNALQWVVLDLMIEITVAGQVIVDAKDIGRAGVLAEEGELVFGRAGVDGVAVSEAEFSRFLDQEVSPRFPDGLTVVDAQGRWTPPAGVSIHEPSKMVMLVLRGAPDEQARLDAVREAYKRRYNQQSVLLMTSSACVSF